MSQTVTVLLMGEFCVRDNSFCLIYNRHVTARQGYSSETPFGE